ncbi:hypothetical protein PsorP6_003958 [Peronosclerospora sorghi]|uniref:Uncharacterized protein n=1 Tax=Peronosclerospora sorghi TaxID=230839 RepID=A0ACC0VPL3_9STRA|nr:hypothetical protein PsorP6_003958 [Peronosclerospora sorghi]
MTEEEFTKFVGRCNQRGDLVFAAAPRVALEALSSTLSASSEKDWTTANVAFWAFAAVAALESSIFFAGQPLTSLSEKQVVDCDTSSYVCEGGFPGNSLSFIQRAVQGIVKHATSSTSKPVTICDVVTVPESELRLLEAISGRPVAVGVAARNHTWKHALYLLARRRSWTMRCWPWVTARVAPRRTIRSRTGGVRNGTRLVTIDGMGQYPLIYGLQRVFVHDQ